MVHVKKKLGENESGKSQQFQHATFSTVSVPVSSINRPVLSHSLLHYLALNIWKQHSVSRLCATLSSASVDSFPHCTTIFWCTCQLTRGQWHLTLPVLSFLSKILPVIPYALAWNLRYHCTTQLSINSHVNANFWLFCSSGNAKTLQWKRPIFTHFV